MLFAAAVGLVSREPQLDPRLKKAVRHAEQGGWTFVHLEGAPAEIGYQHGYLLAPEIREAQKVIELELAHDTKKDWPYFREAAQQGLWPHIEPQYREELEGIAEGVRARGVKLDVWDIVATNAWLEWPYYVTWRDKQSGVAATTRADGTKLTAPEHCSAFVATGSYTRDGRVVMGHNAWTGYLDGERWNIVFDVVPSSGHRFIMDGFPGLIHSADDFGINAAGIMVTETTISRFLGWDPNGIAEFVRARKALQHSSSIDDFARWMTEGNNGGYANNWLVADRNTGEIASLELGLKNVTLRRTRDGYFGGANFPVNEALAKQETEFNTSDPGLSPNARRARWDQLMAEHKGRIDAAAGQRFLADHYDTFDNKIAPSERTLCGHIDLSPRGVEAWQPKYGVAGAVQNKVADASMAERLSFTASMGHACGIHFRAAAHLKEHPEFEWQKPYLRDLIAHPWTTLRATEPRR
ncbi:MAG: peptidase C45 [Candidatus Solibacter usitatus]|nr:peptidase C45 [Candidatus Solibacter usitatus]